MTDLQQSMKRPRRFSPLKIVLIGLCALAIFGGALFLILRSVLGPMVETGDAFMGALRDGNDAQAYMRAAPDLQRSLGGAERLSATIGAYRPSAWSWSTRSVRNGNGELRGSVTYRGGNSGTAQLRLIQVDGQWRVTGFRLN